MDRTPDGPFCLIYQPVAEEHAGLESVIGNTAHVRFASTEVEFTNLIEEVFHDVKKLIVICLGPNVSDFNAIMLARRIRRMMKDAKVIITCRKFIRTWAELGIHFVTNDNLAEASKQLLAA